MAHKKAVSIGNVRMATLAVLRESLLPNFLAPVPCDETLRLWFDRAAIPKYKPSSGARRGGGAIFYDGGNVYKYARFSRFFTDYSNTVGVGLRYDTPVGPVRIDVGRNLNPVPGLKSTQIFVTLGQSF